jgi:hypothetical protein
LIFLYGQGKFGKKEVKVHPEFAKKDVVQLIGLGIEEEEKIVVDAIVINVAGGSLHGVPICKGQVSVTLVKEL